MKKKILGILVMMLLIAAAVLPVAGTMNVIKTKYKALISGPEIEWMKTYGGDQFDQFRCVKQITGGGYIAFGEYEEMDMNYARLIKLDSDGSVNWSVVNYDINASSYDEEGELMNYVIQTSDGGYLASGFSSYYYTDGETGYWYMAGFLWKTNSDGDTEWLKFYYDLEEILWLSIYQMTEVNDGYIGGGMSVDFEDENLTDWTLDFMIQKVDFDGNLSWYKTYDLGFFEVGESFDITDDGYFLSGVYSEDDTWNNDDDEFCMMVTDSDGNLLDYWLFGGEKGDFSPTRGCCQTTDGGYIMCGVTQSYSAYYGDLWDIWLIKTDSNGDEEWNRTFGGQGYENCWGMQMTSDGGFILPIAHDLGGTDDLLLVKTDDIGNVLVNYLFEEDGRQMPIFIDETEDGGFIIGGRTGAPDGPHTDSLLIKISSFENQRANTPAKPTGKTEGKTGEEIRFSTSGSDPDGDRVYFRWDFGDGNFSVWKRSNEVEYTWEKGGVYHIKVMSKDLWGGESGWSNPLTVTITKSRNRVINTPFLNFLQQHLHLFPLLRLLLQR
jgi:hypothetical protein